MNQVCRTYHRNDLEALQRLMSELGYSVGLEALGRNIREIIGRDGEIIVAEKDGAVVGSVCVLMDVRLAEGAYAEIVSLIVSETARGKGIGKALVKEAEAWTINRVDKIRVRANIIRSAAHAFYQSQGYEEKKTQKVFVKKTLRTASASPERIKHQ